MCFDSRSEHAVQRAVLHDAAVLALAVLLLDVLVALARELGLAVHRARDLVLRVARIAFERDRVVAVQRVADVAALLLTAAGVVVLHLAAAAAQGHLAVDAAAKLTALLADVALLGVAVVALDGVEHGLDHAMSGAAAVQPELV